MVYRTGSGEIISQRSDSDACYFDGCVIFAERDTPHHLPENPEETDAEEDLPSADGQSESFDLYSSFRGGKKKLIMENVYRYKCTGAAIYIFKESEKTYEGETLYDVYGGSSLDNIELLISGVLPTR